MTPLEIHGNCMVKGCPCAAKWAPQLNVPALGHSIETHAPLTCIVGLKLCDGHIKTFVPEDNFNRKALAAMFKAAAAGRCPPDLDRIFVTPVSLASATIAQFENIGKSRQ